MVDTADDVVDEAASDEADALESESSPRGGFGSGKIVWIAIGLAAFAFLVAVVLGIWWWIASSSNEYEVALARDQASEVAEAGIRAYTEIDHKNPDEYRNSQQEISTSELFGQNQEGWQTAREQITKQQISVQVKVFDVGVFKLDTHKGEAVALAAIEIKRSAKDVPESTGRMRMIAKLERVEDEWKLADIQHVPEIPTGA